MADNSFSEGFVRGQEISEKRNPFNVILSRFQEAQARRYAEDKERRKEESELQNALIELNKRDIYETEFMKATEEEKRKTKAFESGEETTRQQTLLKAFGLIEEPDGLDKARDISDIASKIPEGVTLDLGEGLKIAGKPKVPAKGELEMLDLSKDEERELANKLRKQYGFSPKEKDFSFLDWLFSKSKKTSKYKTGDIKIINGITYKRDEQGQWLPQQF